MLDFSAMNMLSNKTEYHFDDAIDLMDETLREGAERASISPSLKDKCELGKKISEIGIRSLVIGFLPYVPHTIDLLKKLLILQKNGELSKETRFYCALLCWRRYAPDNKNVR